MAAFYNFPHKKTDDIETGEMETDDIESDEMETNDIKIGEIETDDIEVDEMEAERIKIMCENDKLILTQYLKDLLDLDLKDYVEAAEGEVIIREEENYSMIKVRIFKEYEETVLEILDDTFSGKNNKREPYVRVPPFPQNSLIEEVETKDWKYTFERAKSGKYALTKDIFIYVAYDADRLYLYFWEL